MDSSNRIKELKETEKELLDNFAKIVRYHGVDEETIYSAEKNIENVFEWMIKFYEYADKKDNSSKKALMLGVVNIFSNLNIPMMYDCMFESPIEFLLYSALNMTMPQKVKEKMFLMPQVKVCSEKYSLDMALMLRKDPVQDGTEGIPLIGIECDGYNYHYDNAEKVTKTNERIRKIKMEEGIEIFQYTGKEIYSNCVELAKEFWEYTEKYVLHNQNYKD